MYCTLSKAFIGNDNKPHGTNILHVGYNLPDCIAYAEDELDNLDGREHLAINILTNNENGDFIKPSFFNTKEGLIHAKEYIESNLKDYRFIRVATIHNDIFNEHGTIAVFNSDSIEDEPIGDENCHHMKAIRNAAQELFSDENFPLTKESSFIKIEDFIEINFVIRSIIKNE